MRIGVLVPNYPSLDGTRNHPIPSDSWCRTCLVAAFCLNPTPCQLLWCHLEALGVLFTARRNKHRISGVLVLRLTPHGSCINLLSHGLPRDYMMQNDAKYQHGSEKSSTYAVARANIVTDFFAPSKVSTLPLEYLPLE